MRDYVRAAFTARGMVADWVIHDKAGNPHVHVMLTTRPLSESGFASNVTPIRDDAGQLVRTAEGKIKYAVWNDGAAVLREWRGGGGRGAGGHPPGEGGGEPPYPPPLPGPRAQRGGHNPPFSPPRGGG